MNRTLCRLARRRPIRRWVVPKYAPRFGRVQSSLRTSSTSLSSSTTNDYDDSKNKNDSSAVIIAKPSRDSLQRLAELSRPEWNLIALSAATLGITSTITLLLPFCSGQVIDYTILLQNSTAETTMTSPIVMAGGLFGLTAVAGGGVYLRSLWLARAGNRIVARLKQQLFASLLRQESAYLDQQNTGDLLSRLSADAQLVQSAVTHQAVAALRGTVMSGGSAAMLLYTSPTLAAVSVCTLPPIFIATQWVGRQLQEQQEQVQKLQGEATSLAEQALSGIATVKQFVSEHYETTRYRNAVASAHGKALETAHRQAQLEAGAHIAANGAVLCVLGYGGTLVLDGSITAGDLTGFVMYSLLMAGNLSGLTSLYADLMRSMAASNRVFDMLDREPSIQSAQDAASTKDLDRDPLTPVLFQPLSSGHLNQAVPVSVELDAVNFRYPSRPELQVLHNFSLKVSPGEVVCLTGGSGSGKSTVAGLLNRLYDVHVRDSIRVDGQPVSSYDPHDLRRMIGIVSQDPTIFRGSIRDNIVYGAWGNVTEDQIVRAAEQAHVMDFVQDFPEGLDTMVGPRGNQLSGGQRQRIAIARVLLKDPPIMILDEASSSLDSVSEHVIGEAMKVAMVGRTVLSIAHRLSTIRNATRIAVVEDGSVVQEGTFADLSSADGPFRQLMRNQL